MIKQILCLPILIFIIFSASSCGGYNCGEAEGLKISTVGLTAAEIDTIILKKFVKGSGFTSLVDTLIIDSLKAYFQFPFTTSDTSFMGSLSPDVLMNSKYDYEVYIPSINKLVKITDIYEPQQKMKRAFLSTEKTYCVNVIQSYQQDGKTITTGYNNQVYISR